ncbi:MAG: hypothetical protein ABIP55_14685 [Tepidisphaeraceae bacterium]
MFLPSIVKHIRDALLVLALGLFGIANAEGPVSVANLPGGGGNVVSDTDVTEGNSLGQRWGRSGGRTITYHVAGPSTFSALVFGVVQGTAPSLAFDAAVTPSTSEIMSYNSGQSLPAQGMVRWTGAANLPLFNGGVNNLPTRFTMTVTRASNGATVPLAIDPSGSNLMASVLTTGDFRVNLLFEMQDLGNVNIFRPVLDYYDTLATPPGQPPSTNTGPVMTGVNTGFYYTLADTGMTIEEHDAHVQALFDALMPKVNNIEGKINFLHTDWGGRIPAIQTQVGNVNNTLNNSIAPTLSQIQQQVSQLLGQSGGTGNTATRDDIRGLQDILMIMLGMAPCPVNQAPPGFCTDFGNLKKLGGDTTQILIGLNNANAKLTTVASQASVDGILIGLNNALAGVATQSSVNALDGKVSALQSSLNAKIDELQDSLDNMSSQSLEVRAVQIDSGNPKQLRWLVKTTRDGVMVNANLTRFATIRASGAAALTNVLGNATVNSLGAGLHDVTLALVKDVTDGVAYLFEASLTAGGSTIQGSALLVTEKKGASPF